MDASGIAALYARRGHLAYDGEGITQWQHAWQCGQLARQAGAPPALQLAAWLHDLGHLMTGLDDTPTLRGHDDRHEAVAARALAPLFGPAVAEPVALHVHAKRYLVATRPGYRDKLSPDSVRSLALQGGPMDEAACAAFLRQPFSADAVRLRAWDEAGKRPEWLPPPDAATTLQHLMRQLGA
jgi:phosphonate degradation associated HDIG domain protein